ncbi:hypothetical protein PanWU01x14_255370 [Parasponia andersonii]|uniref:Uncharacterized protein n=1 Tax=Parasponia andersonii TaxID=3476 RepID=A0A2P5BAX1_PARAD|nr:hypothetical protein PanWU01x14_255370 [Parasponia andersonii]
MMCKDDGWIRMPWSVSVDSGKHASISGRQNSMGGMTQLVGVELIRCHQWWHWLIYLPIGQIVLLPR